MRACLERFSVLGDPKVVILTAGHTYLGIIHTYRGKVDSALLEILPTVVTQIGIPDLPYWIPYIPYLNIYWNLLGSILSMLK